VTNPNPVNVAASVRQRLKNIADRTGRPFAEVLQWCVIQALAMPILAAIADGERFEKRWRPGVGWQS